MTATAPDEIPSSEDHAYFLAIERTFLGLRKKAALLTAADWQEAQSWHRQGIPVELIQDVMEKLFERQHAAMASPLAALDALLGAQEALRANELTAALRDLGEGREPAGDVPGRRVRLVDAHATVTRGTVKPVQHLHDSGAGVVVAVEIGHAGDLVQIRPAVPAQARELVVEGHETAVR